MAIQSVMKEDFTFSSTTQGCNNVHLASSLPSLIGSFAKMPELEDITYDRNECIAAVRDFYDFLTKMYLPEHCVQEPPEGGWPNITKRKLDLMNKSDEILALLRQLPYIHSDRNTVAIPGCKFAHWNEELIDIDGEFGEHGAETCKVISDPIGYDDAVPPDVIGLCAGGPYNGTIMLDTKLGAIYWIESPSETWPEDHVEMLHDDPYEWSSEREAEWRGEAGAWEIQDFFEMIKQNYRLLNFVPLSPNVVRTIWPADKFRDDPVLKAVKDIFRQYGWPDLEDFKKRECWEAIYNKLKKDFPEELDRQWESDVYGAVQ